MRTWLASLRTAEADDSETFGHVLQRALALQTAINDVLERAMPLVPYEQRLYLSRSADDEDEASGTATKKDVDVAVRRAAIVAETPEAPTAVVTSSTGDEGKRSRTFSSSVRSAVSFIFRMITVN